MGNGSDTASERKLRVSLGCLLVMALGLVAACGGTSSPETVDATVPPVATQEPAPTATPEAMPEQPAPTATPETMPEEPAETTPEPDSNASTGIDYAITLVLNAFDAGGIERVEALWPDGWQEEDPFLVVLDDNNEVVLHHDDELVGRSIVGELGRDMYGYPWHERLLSLPPGGGFVVMLNRTGSHNPIVGGEVADAPAELSIFDDWRASQANYRAIQGVQHAGYLFVFVSAEQSAVRVTTKTLELSAQLLAGDAGDADDVEAVEDAVAAANQHLDALIHIAHWLNDNAGSDGQFVGFIADENGVIVGSRFDPSVVGMTVEELLGTDVLGQATTDGFRYRDDASGVDVILLSTPNGFVVGGGIASAGPSQ